MRHEGCLYRGGILTNVMSPKKVLFLTYGFVQGGAETFLVNLLNGVDRRRCAPVVVSLGAKGILEERLSPDITVLRSPRKWKYDLSPAQEIAALLRKESIDTVFALGLFSYFFAHLAIKKVGMPVRLLVSIHSTKPRSMKELVSHFIYTRMLGRSEQLVAVCENQKQYYKRRFGLREWQFAPVIYNGVDTDHWSLPPASFDVVEERMHSGIPGNAIVILNVSRFRPEKRHDIMVRAFAKLPDSWGGRKPYLVFVGGAGEASERNTRQLAQQLRVAERIVFCSSRGDNRPLYWLADLFTLASTSETFSIAALEAMSTGLPCVLTDVGGANEMVTPSVNGILVEPGSPDALAQGWMECVARLGEMEPTRIRKATVERFSLSSCIAAYRDLLLGQNVESS